MRQCKRSSVWAVGHLVKGKRINHCFLSRLVAK